MKIKTSISDKIKAGTNRLYAIESLYRSLEYDRERDYNGEKDTEGDYPIIDDSKSEKNSIITVLQGVLEKMI